MIWFVAKFIKFLCWTVAQTPRRVQVFAGRGLGCFWYYVIPVRKKVALENLTIAFPYLGDTARKSMVRENFQNYGCGLIEFLMLPYLDEKLFSQLFVVEGIEHYQRAVAQGKGVFFLTLHLGSWELMSASQRNLKIPLHVITKKFKTRSLNRIWVELRLDRGIKLIEEEKSTFQILRAIRGGEAVGFILDQFMGPPVGTRVKFFGKETGAPAALALFSDRTRAPVIPVYNYRMKDGRICVVFEPEVPFSEQGGTAQNISFMTQVYTSKIEEIIKKHPEQWLWIHRRWKVFRE